MKLSSGLTGSRNMPLVMAASSHFKVYLTTGLREDCCGCRLHLKFQCFEREMDSFQPLLWAASLFCAFAFLVCHSAWLGWEERQIHGSVKFHHSTARPTGLIIAGPLQWCIPSANSEWGYEEEVPKCNLWCSRKTKAKPNQQNNNNEYLTKPNK